MSRIRRRSLKAILGQPDELSTVLETVKEALQDCFERGAGGLRQPTGGAAGRRTGAADVVVD